MSPRSSMRCMGLVLLAALTAGAQQTAQLVPPHDSLLPPSFGQWKAVTPAPPAPAAAKSMALADASKPALEECVPQRSEVAAYNGPGGRVLHVEAIQFADYTGVWSAYTLVRQPGLKDAKDLGQNDAVGEDSILFTAGTVLVHVFPATAADVPGLKPLVASLPPAYGAAAQPPLLPAFLPAKGLQSGSVRYAVGPATYAAQGGVLPASSVGWDKSAEAITARYVDKRGDETLTLLLYPTPQIATAHLKLAQSMLPGLGPKFATAKTRREAELVMVANGTFSSDLAQQMLENIHMKQFASVDKNMAPSFHTQVGQAASMLTNIAVLSGVLCSAAVLLGLFLGGGRALIRVMRGKPAATEAEFLSLHLANQNAPAVFTPEGPEQEPEKP